MQNDHVKRRTQDHTLTELFELRANLVEAKATMQDHPPINIKNIKEIDDAIDEVSLYIIDTTPRMEP